jgi:hypothetical protein
MILTSHEGITAIHSDGWKYIDGVVREPAPYAFFGDSRQAAEAHEQLYDIENDPYEKNDLVTKNPDQAIKLGNILQYFRNLGYSRTFEVTDSIQTDLPTVQANSNVKVYPNPFLEYFTIEINDLEGEWEIILSDLSGRGVAKMQNCNTNRVHFHRNGLKNGVYVYQVVSGNKSIGTGKIILR